MTREVHAAGPGATLSEASHKMRVLDVGMLPVYDGSRVLGVVTDRDIVVRGVAYGMDPATTPVERVMTPHAQSCFVDEDIGTAVRKMEEQQVRRLIVTDRIGVMVGVISLGDIAARGGRRMACEAFDRIVESG